VTDNNAPIQATVAKRQPTVRARYSTGVDDPGRWCITTDCPTTVHRTAYIARKLELEGESGGVVL